MQFTFVANGQDGRKRKAPFAACDRRKKNKKRCRHGEDAVDSKKHPSEPHGKSPATSRPTFPVPPTRFVGELDPQVRFDHDQHHDPRQPDRHGVGAWVADGTQDSDSSDAALDQFDGSNVVRLLPPPDDISALVNIFLTRVQPIIPILGDSTQVDSATISTWPTALLQAICLVASKDERARNHLRLSTNSPLPVTLFAKRIYRTALRNMRGRPSSLSERMDIIRAYLLLSLHGQGAHASEEASMNLTMAVHHAHTIGLHLGRVGGEWRIQRERHETDDACAQDDRMRLFWCLWSVDKLNAALNGRPRLLVKDDIVLDLQTSVAILTPASRLWMRISALLDDSINLYSPHSSSWRQDSLRSLVTFEELLEFCVGQESKLDDDVAASLELFYHAVAIVSCRLSIQAPESREPLLRRSQSAMTICAMLDHVELCNLAQLPVMAYAVSLALLVAYQQSRQSQTTSRGAMAKVQLEQCQRTLVAMSPAWRQAKNMARIGQRVLVQMSCGGDEDTIDQTSSDTSRRPQPLRASRGKRSSVQGGNAASTVAPDGGTLAAEPLPAVDANIQENDTDVVQPDTGLGRKVDSMPSGTLDLVAHDTSAFADMDAVFGNLMDMNAFPDIFDMSFSDWPAEIGANNNNGDPIGKGT